jgi:hypothetical protein
VRREDAKVVDIDAAAQVKIAFGKRSRRPLPVAGEDPKVGDVHLSVAVGISREDEKVQDMVSSQRSALAVGDSVRR